MLQKNLVFQYVRLLMFSGMRNVKKPYSLICFPFNYNYNNNKYIVSVSSPIHSLQSNGLKLSSSLSLVSCYTSRYETHVCLSKQHTKETKAINLFRAQTMGSREEWRGVGVCVFVTWINRPY